MPVLVRVSIAVKRHHDRSNSYKGEHLIGAGLWGQSPLLSWQEAWQHAGRHGAGEVAESSMASSAGSRRKTETLSPMRPHIFQ